MADRTPPAGRSTTGTTPTESGDDTPVTLPTETELLRHAAKGVRLGGPRNPNVTTAGVPRELSDDKDNSRSDDPLKKSA